MSVVLSRALEKKLPVDDDYEPKIRLFTQRVGILMIGWGEGVCLPTLSVPFGLKVTRHTPYRYFCFS